MLSWVAHGKILEPRGMGGLNFSLYLKHVGEKYVINVGICLNNQNEGGQWLSGRVLDLRPRGSEFEPHLCHCVVSLSKTH